ncbi:FtsX-like permease family protein [Parasedimentitalea huanghaiensis]|uniref:FtsX-like permease family protein n=1 Tax=Parasedimentitalea huanghaiensis TaxID=2682100 RepID=A0A6L6WBF4_9RHOB|nr:FtsX-like permease family protein [Zongyanglinia huanghaiensis]MVO14578.1 FtsX-like permease family protein [Zongyanglinia huanghaiensis]
MKRAALGALLSHWWRHPLQLITLLTGLALATGLWSAVQAINGEAKASYNLATSEIGARQNETLVPKTGFIPLSRYVELRRSGWRLSPVLEGRWPQNTGSLRLIGVDLLSHPTFSNMVENSDSESSFSLDALSSQEQLFLNPKTLEQLTVHVDLPPIVQSDQIPIDVALGDISLVERLLQRPGQITRMIILPEQPLGLHPLEDLAPELQRQSYDAGQMSRLTDSFHLNLTAFGLLSFAVGLFIVHGSVSLGIEQRRGLFRTLRAMGVPLHLLTVLLLCELLLIAIVAGSAGLVLGYLIAAALLPDVSATLSGLYGATVEGSLNLRPGWLISGIAMAVVGTLIASTQAITNIYKMPLLATPGLQARAQAASSQQYGMAVLGLALMAFGTASMLVFDGLIAGFALLAGMMLGTALMLPLLLSWVLTLGLRNARSALGEWIWADMRAQLPGISLALMALLLALATNIGVGTMVSSFRLTFLGWMDQRLSAELYVTAKDEDQAQKLVLWLTRRDITVLPIRWSEVPFHGTKLRIYGVQDDPTYREKWPMLQVQNGAWDRVSNGTAVMINEQLARRRNLWPGDDLNLTPSWKMTVVGVYSDYGNPHEQAIVTLPVLLRHADNVPNLRFGLRLPPSGVQNLIKEIQQESDFEGITMVDQNDLKARSLAVFDRTFVVTGALNLLTLGVAGFAILTSLLTLWNMRLPQLAPIWALGITRRQLAWLELWRSLALAALTALLALPLGLLLAWLLLSVINVEAFGWKLPMYIFPLDWLRLLVMALVAAAIAAAIPARKLALIKPSELLKVFAHER